jgi:hypothetical protein
MAPNVSAVHLWRNRRRLRSWIAVSFATVFVAVAGIAYAAGYRAQTLTFGPFVAANPDPDGCLGASGLYVDMIAYLKKPPTSVAGYNKLMASNTPSRTTLSVGSSTYQLSLDRSASFAGNEQIGWEFRAIALDTKAAAKVIGQHAVIRYKIGRKSIVSCPESTAVSRHPPS